MKVRIIAVLLFVLFLLCAHYSSTRMKSELMAYEVVKADRFVGSTDIEPFELINECSPYFAPARNFPGGSIFGLSDRAGIYYRWAVNYQLPIYLRLRLADEALITSYMAIQLAPTDYYGWQQFAYGAGLYGWTNIADHAKSVHSYLDSGMVLTPHIDEGK